MQLDYESDSPLDNVKSLEKELTLNVAVSQLASNFDRESNLCLERFSRTRHASVISAGSLKLDLALGIGALPKGKMLEIFGREASGKTTLALHIVKEAQKNGGYCAYIDAENAFNPSFAEAIGVDTEKLLIAQPDSAENSLSMVNTLVGGSIDVVVVDSIYLLRVVSRGTPALQTIQMAFLGLKRWLSIYAKSLTGIQSVAKLVYRDRWKRLIRARRRQEELYLPLIKACQERRRGRGNDGGDAVTSYVDSLLDLEVPAEVDTKGKGIHRGRRRRKLSEGEMVGLVSEYMGAATETVLTATEWTLANLVRRPDIQSRLRDEVEAGSGEACAYLRAVVMESLRRHPTVPSVVRHMSSDVLLGSTPVTQGSVVNFVVAKIGRDKKIWTSPDEFSPDRFMPGGEGAGVRLNSSGGGKEAKTTTMMPFGAGRRICPGMGYAILHLEYFLANLVTAFEWHQVEGEVVDLEEKPGFFTTMQNPLRARVVPRTATAL